MRDKVGSGEPGGGLWTCVCSPDCGSELGGGVGGGHSSLLMLGGLAFRFFSSLNYRRKDSLAKDSLGLSKPKLFGKKIARVLPIL